jgi:hypothetical protein
MSFASTFQNNGTFSIGSGSATSSDDVTNAAGATINNNSGTWNIVKGLTNSGTYNKNTGTLKLVGGNAQSFPGMSMYNFTVQKTDGTVATMTVGSTVSSAFSLVSGILDVNSQTFNVAGTYSNSGGLVMVSSGSIVHPAESIAFTDSNGVPASSYTVPASMYVTLNDPDQNLSATNTESIVLTLSGNGNSGSDSESVTLVETGPATGVFRNALSMDLRSAAAATLGNGTFESIASGVGTASYTDTLDGSDTLSTTVTLTVATSNNGGGGGGGGGVGSAGVPSIPSPDVKYQTYLQNIKNLGIPVHSLVKLPDDGNPNTQEDTAVYYIGADGKRHAFPNDKIYFTWYSNFDGVQVISLEQLSTITLGANVTYKPGVRMVKFTTDPKVYVVAKGGVLRWVKTEQIATDLYGADWNKHIDDLSDALYTNYSFGADVNGLSDFSPAAIQASVTYPSDSLAL